MSECSSFQGENLDHRAPLPPHPRWWTVAEVGEFKIRALIDSGASPGLTAIGLEGPTPDEEKELEEILARCLPVNDESSLIGCTDLIEHEIEVTCQRPIKQRCYPVSKKLEDIMYEQLDNMIRQGIVKPSKSSWASPVVMVGELVLRRNRILSSAANQIAAKLAPKFYGPLIITAKVGTNIYELADRQGVPVGPTHVKDLKRFHGSSDEFEQDDGEIESDDEDEQAEIQESPEEMHQDARPQEQEEEDEQIARPQESQIEKGPRPRKTRALVVRQKEPNKVTGRKPITKAGEGTKMSSEQSETAEDSDSEPGKHQGDEMTSRRITRAAARKKATAKGCAVASEGDTVAQL
uniref:Reverse transcriptase n=1 Tax=Trichogramma kaykai TaxID=54128 RepID=A0ABD2W4F9_9HYME